MSIRLIIENPTFRIVHYSINCVRVQETPVINPRGAIKKSWRATHKVPRPHKTKNVHLRLPPHRNFGRIASRVFNRAPSVNMNIQLIMNLNISNENL